MSNRTLWIADRLNQLETGGLLLAAATIVSDVALPANLLLSTQTHNAYLGVACLLITMAQGLRYLQTSARVGPLVLMAQTMFEKDIVEWSLVTLLGVVLPVGVSLAVALRSIDQDELSDCAKIDMQLNNLLQHRGWQQATSNRAAA